ncbi:interleukin-6 [Neoarius graeffei]|uniref:interleukin-6 n=1 Tax=Neoarius graeffei TaxID=443677 RepID=UPI00298CA010|nr:interleukin-6 [Neoarius graeffei]
MPSLLRYLTLSLLALLPLPSLSLYSGDAGFYETSGGEPQNDAHVPDHKWLSIAKQLRRDIASVRDEQFKRDFAETFNMTEFAGVRMEMPLLGPSDGCLPSDFIPQTCLQQIYSGLRWYQAYLPDVERENLNADLMKNIHFGTTRLLHLIKEIIQVNNDKADLPSLPDDSAWKRKILTHSILYYFADFMTDTARAINFMKTKKLTKHIIREDGWLLKHKQ